MPFLPVPFGPLFIANGGNVGQYPINAGPNFQEQYGTSGTYQDPVAGSARDQYFVPRGTGGGFNRGMARGHKNPKPFVPYDTCARCGEKGHWRNECPHEGYRPPSPQKQYVPTETDVSKSDVNQNGVRYLYGKGILMYVEVELKGCKISAIFDTGCPCIIMPLQVL